MANSRTSRRHPAAASPRTPGPLGCNDSADPNSPDSLIGDTPGPLGVQDSGDPKFTGPVGCVTKEDEDEFKLLEGKITDVDAAAYVTHRRTFFGSDADYKSYAASADFELDNSTRKTGKRVTTLRSQIELTGDAQTIFYRWVRKAYENAGIKDVPTLIWQRNSEALANALAKVKANYSGSFKPQGFNPRPMKIKGKYRLGTISEHGLGAAVDIEPQANAQLTGTEWKFVEKLTGKSVDRTLNRWKDSPEALWKEVRDLSALFVTTVAAEVQRINDERAAVENGAAGTPGPAGAPKSKKPKIEPINIVLAGHLQLKQWAGNGFFNLEWALVKELHASGLKWGVTFPDPDLQHFELT